MRTHKQIIKDADGPSAVARILGLDVNTTKQWKRLDSIPAPYWTDLVREGVCTLEELAEAAAPKRKARISESGAAA